MLTQRWWSLALATCVMACGGKGDRGASALVSTSPEAAGVHCPSGGTAVSTGVDRNGNGVLDASEITATTYVCNGAPGGTVGAQTVTGATGETGATGATGASGATGATVAQGPAGPQGPAGANAIISVVTLPPGSESCPAGGLEITAFTDLDANGVWNGDEPRSVTTTCFQPSRVYVATAAPCGGIPPDGCDHGGVQLQSFLDVNGDGKLDGDEVVDSTQWICNASPGHDDGGHGDHGQGHHG